MATIYHIATNADWTARSDTYAPTGWRDEGFVHCSTDEQLVRTANRVFPGRFDLTLLQIDTDMLQALVVWEDTADAGEDFPHIYGPIEVDAVIAATPFAAADDGTFDWWSAG